MGSRKQGILRRIRIPEGWTGSRVLTVIPCQRHLFHIPDDIAYLNCAYMSPQLRSVTEAGRESTALKAHPWRIIPKDFFDASERARELCAQIMGTDAGDIAIIPAVSYGMAIAAANVKVPRNSSIVVLAEQFPSNVYPWKELAREKGANMITVPRPEDWDWTTALLSAMDQRTAVVAVPHCHWTDGTIIDLEKVSARCREIDAALVLDVTQSLGALPLPLKKVEPDFMVTAAYKWLLGPYSTGFMYVAPHHQEGRPLENNWISRVNSEDFASLVNYSDEYQAGARRFDVGERSNFALMPMTVAALSQILQWQVPRIAETLSRMTDRISERARELALAVSPRQLRAGHLLGLRFQKGVPQGLSDRLAREKVYVSVRGDSVRVAPHLYNTRQDIDRLFKVLEAVSEQD